MDQVVLRIRLGGIRRETSWYERKPTGAMGILVRAKKIILSLWTCSLALNAYKPVDTLGLQSSNGAKWLDCLVLRSLVEYHCFS